MFQPMSLVILAVIVLVIFLGVFFLFERWLKHREREWAFMLKTENNKAMSPLRISAYERTIIMLERITPTSLVMRQNLMGKSAGAMQLELIKAIREEFELNVSLQMYMSEAAWQRVVKAKDETTELVKIAFSRVTPESSAIDLSREIFQLEAMTGNALIKEAIIAIRTEIARHY